MTATGLAGVLVLAMGLMGAVAGPGHAQDSAGSLSVAAAPRLHFSPEQIELALAVADDADLAAFYGGNGLQPIFDSPEGAARRQALHDAIAAMPDHGIPASRYPLPPSTAPAAGMEAELAHARQTARLLRDLTGGVLIPANVDPEIKRQPDPSPVPALLTAFQSAADPGAVLDGAAPDLPAYRALQAALKTRADLTVPADLPRIPDGLWRPGTQGAGIGPLRARLAAIGFTTAPAPNPDRYDAALSEAVAGYQRAAGLPDDGIAGPRTIARLNGEDASGPDARQRAITVALERLRWMGAEDLQARHVWVNIPEFSTTILQDGAEVFRTRSVMGKDTPEMRTPEFSDMMANVVVNPSWNVPRSITVRDYLPKLQANRHAVSHLDVLDGSGRVLARDGIDFSQYSAANFPFRLRQKPSDDNALGIVKFIFPNPWNASCSLP
jgi:L,D-transpeptidase YcbB